MIISGFGGSEKKRGVFAPFNTVGLNFMAYERNWTVRPISYMRRNMKLHQFYLCMLKIIFLHQQSTLTMHKPLIHGLISEILIFIELLFACNIALIGQLQVRDLVDRHFWLAYSECQFFKMLTSYLI